MKELREIGLTDGEIKVYLALLKLGPSTNSPIARQTGLQSSTVYYCLNSLIEKGLVTYIKRGNRKYFNAVNPENLPSIIDEKIEDLTEQKIKINEIIPQLKLQQRALEEQTIAEVYEGFRSFQNIFNEILNTLKRGEGYEAFVIEQEVTEPKKTKLLFMRHNKALKAKGVKLRLLAPEQLRKIFEKMYGKKFLKTYQEIRYTKERIIVGTTIYKNNVITHISEDGKPIAFKIRNKKLAEMYKNYFYEVWKRAKV